MGMIVWSPLDGGFLSGKYRATDDIAGDNRISRFQRMFRGSFDPEAELFQHKLRLVGELAAVADEAGLPMAQMAVAFAIEHPSVTSAIIGPRTMDHLESLLAVGEMRLALAILDRIDALVPPGTSVNPIVDVPNALGKESLRRAR
jgi:aryl-alcohol dehydrogenase-like predicted oxidoreductase